MINQDELIQTLIERSLEDALRAELVAEGYLPDYTIYTTDAAWKTQLNVIRGTHGFAIEVFGHSNSQDKGTKQVPRFVFIPGKTVPGDVGLEFSPVYEQVKTGETIDHWIKNRIPYETANFQFELHIVCESAKQHRIMHHIYNKVIGARRFMKLYNDPTQLFFQEQIGFYDQPDTIDGITEVVYQHEVKDLYAHAPIALGTIAKITEINLEITPMGLARLLENGTLTEEAPFEVHTLKVDPHMMVERFYTHTGADSDTSGVIANLSTAAFVGIERGTKPIKRYTGVGAPPIGQYKINNDNTLTINPIMRTGEELHLLMQI